MFLIKSLHKCLTNTNIQCLTLFSLSPPLVMKYLIDNIILEKIQFFIKNTKFKEVTLLYT